MLPPFFQEKNSLWKMCYNYRILLLAEIINHCDNFIPEDSPQDVYQIIDFSAIIHTKIRFNEFKSNFKKVEDACNFSDLMIVSQRYFYVFIIHLLRWSSSPFAYCTSIWFKTYGSVYSNRCVNALFSRQPHSLTYSPDD